MITQVLIILFILFALLTLGFFIFLTPVFWGEPELFYNAVNSFLLYNLLRAKGSHKALRQHYERYRDLQSGETPDRASFKSRLTIWKRFSISPESKISPVDGDE